jgi:hypothetical protein
MTRRLPVIAAATTLSLVLGLVVAAVNAGPATAAPETCPTGLPSRSVSPKAVAPAGSANAGSANAGSGKATAGNATPANGAAGKAAAGTAGAGRATAGKAAAPAPAPKPDAATTPTPTPTAPAADQAAKDTGNPIVDGWNNFIDGVGHLLGIGGDETPSPTPSPSATPATSPAPGTASSPPPAGSPGPGNGPGTAPGPGSGSGPASTASPSPTPIPSPSPSLPDVPCLGPRVFKAATLDDGQPKVSIRGGLLEGKSLLMTGSTYDGVVDLPTATGTVKTLKFSMENAVTEPFTLTIPENGGHKTVIKTDKLEIDKNVKFYTSRFAGNLFGIIPVVFTPESPPPLTVYKLWFTNVSIDLDYVSCHTLTATPMLSVTAVQ